MLHSVSDIYLKAILRCPIVSIAARDSDDLEQ